jgi:excisionase family DNA binding protein
MENEKLLVRPVEAAAMLSVSRSSIYELIAAGVVPSVRIGRMIRVPVAAIRKLAEQANERSIEK